MFRRLVVARLCYPASILKTTDYLSKYQFFNVDVQVVYRYLDKLYNSCFQNENNWHFDKISDVYHFHIVKHVINRKE